MLRIDVALDHEPFAVDVERLRKAVSLILKDAGFKRGAISLAIVDDGTIHDVNRKFLNHDEPTDVISFVLEEDDAGIEAELVLGADTAARTAAELGVSPDDELLLYAIHGALHLVGYDDLSDEPRVEMRAAEQKYLTQFGVVLPGPSADA